MTGHGNALLLVEALIVDQPDCIQQTLKDLFSAGHRLSMLVFAVLLLSVGGGFIFFMGSPFSMASSVPQTLPSDGAATNSSTHISSVLGYAGSAVNEGMCLVPDADLSKLWMNTAFESDAHAAADEQHSIPSDHDGMLALLVCVCMMWAQANKLCCGKCAFLCKTLCMCSTC